MESKAAKAEQGESIKSSIGDTSRIIKAKHIGDRGPGIAKAKLPGVS
jgi:hypothetical protein